MPSLGADMDSGTLLEWFVKPGDEVKRGDIVALVDTSKAEIEVEIFEDGVIDELIVAPGTRVPVGAVLATVGTAGAPPAPAAATPPAPAAATPTAPAPPAPPAPPTAAPPAIAVDGHRVRVSPLARRVAQQLGVDLAAVTGTGFEGAITRADIEHAVAVASPPAPPVPAAPEVAHRQEAMRQAIAVLMARSKREIPHYYLELQIDMSRPLEWLREENLRRPVTKRLLPAALLLSAVAHAVVEMPEMNGFWVDDAFHPGGRVHLGVATSLRSGGLIAPALHDADRMSLEELMAGTQDLVQRARAGRLRSSEMSDPTITVTNLGDRGVDLVHGVIYPPQVALVGFGAVRERPWAVNGLLGVRPVVTATLAADHRASDGHAGGRFLAIIERKLNTPEEL